MIEHCTSLLAVFQLNTKKYRPLFRCGRLVCIERESLNPIKFIKNITDCVKGRYACVSLCFPSHFFHGLPPAANALSYQLSQLNKLKSWYVGNCVPNAAAYNHQDKECQADCVHKPRPYRSSAFSYPPQARRFFAGQTKADVVDPVTCRGMTNGFVSHLMRLFELRLIKTGQKIR